MRSIKVSEIVKAAFVIFGIMALVVAIAVALMFAFAADNNKWAIAATVILGIANIAYINEQVYKSNL